MEPATVESENNAPKTRIIGRPFTADNQPESRGRPKGSRDKINREFLTDLLDVYAKHGRAAIEHVAQNDQTAFFNALVKLQPKEIEITTPESAMSDEQLEALYAQMMEWLSKQAASAETAAARANGEKLSTVNINRVGH